MSLTTRRWLALYLILLVGLSALGASNQRLYDLQSSLIAHKEALRLELADLRRQAAAVNGTLAVRQWAYANGMVPATEIPAQLVAPLSPPSHEALERGVELYTQWR